MAQHEVLCLEGKGWKKVQDQPVQSTKEPIEQSTSAGVTPSMQTQKQPTWIWLGPEEDQAALEKRLEVYGEKCFRRHGIDDPRKALS